MGKKKLKWSDLEVRDLITNTADGFVGEVIAVASGDHVIIDWYHPDGTTMNNMAYHFDKHPTPGSTWEMTEKAPTSKKKKTKTLSKRDLVELVLLGMSAAEDAIILDKEPLENGTVEAKEIVKKYLEEL